MCSVFVTARTEEQELLLRDIAEAVDALGIDVGIDGEALVIDGARFVPGIVARAHPTPADLSAASPRHVTNNPLQRASRPGAEGRAWRIAEERSPLGPFALARQVLVT